MSAVSNPERIRLLLRERDGDNCWLCKEPLDFTLPAHYKLSVTIDHVIPRAARGGSRLPNLRLAHRKCNNQKGALHDGTDYAVLSDPGQNPAARSRLAGREPARPRPRREGLQQPAGDAFWATYLKDAERAARERPASDAWYAQRIAEGQRILAACENAGPE